MADTAKTFSLEEVKKHKTEKSCWLVIHGKVYDVTDFLEEHPGGYDIILTATGRDATQDFEEIGHSNSAKEYLKKYLIGTFEGGDSAPVDEAAAKLAAKTQSTSKSQVSILSRAFSVLLPIILILIALAMSYGKN